MHGQCRKIDPSKILKLRSQGLSSVQIARRLGLSVSGVSRVVREAKLSVAGQAGSVRDGLNGRKRL